jgi:hypothetical protein
MTEREENIPALNELAAALVQFQAVVPVIAKTQTAKIKMKSGGEYSYKYADLADIWDAIRKPLLDNGLAVTQSLVGGSDGWTGIKTIVWHKSGQTFSDILDVPTSEKSAQETGSQFTYFKRYALAAILGISTEEDDDGKAGNEKPTASAKGSAKQRNYLESLMKQANIDQRTIDAKIAALDTADEFSNAIEKMKEMLGVGQ